MSLKYAIIGTGALGGIYGGMLAKSGKHVDFLVNRDYEYIQQNGLKVDSILGNFHLEKPAIYSSSKDMQPVDVVFVCLKTSSNGLLKEILPSLLHQSTLVVLIQNGLEMEADLAVDFPELNIAGGLAYICSTKVSSGHVVHSDLGKLVIGSFQGDNDAVIKQIVDDLTNAGIDAESTPNLKQARWQKLVWNIPFNGLSVLLNADTQQLLNTTETFELCEELMLDVVEAANYCGVIIKKDYVQKLMNMTARMKPYMPSMKHDYNKKRTLEIEYIYTRPLLAAAKAGYKMKSVKFLQKQLMYVEKNY